MRKFLAVALFVLFPFMAQAQQAPQVPPLQAPTMSEVSDNGMVIVAVIVGAAVGAVLLPLAAGGLATVGTAAAGAAAAGEATAAVAIHTYPFMAGLGAALGAWVGYSM